MKVVAIVVNYDADDLATRCTSRLYECSQGELDVVVVDNPPPHDRGLPLRDLDPRARVIWNETNVGFGRACNIGADATEADFLAFLNPDVIVQPGWLDPLLRAFESNERIGIMSPTVLRRGDPLPSKTGAAETAAVPGCSLVISRDAWRRLGGFDSTMFLYWEDTDLCWRAWLDGWLVMEHFEAVVLHEHGLTGGGPQWKGQQIQNGLYTYLKLMRARYVAVFLLVSFLRTLKLALQQRDPRLWSGWFWNLRRLRATAEARKRIATTVGRRRRLEKLVVGHQRRAWREQRARAASQRPRLLR